MRVTLFAAVSALAYANMALAAPTMAQEQPGDDKPVSAQEYACMLANKCGQAPVAAAPTNVAPQPTVTKIGLSSGYAVAGKASAAADEEGEALVGATRSITFGRHKDASTPVATYTAPQRQASIAAAAPARPAAVQRPRVERAQPGRSNANLSIQFVSGSAELTPVAKNNLRNLAEFVSREFAAGTISTMIIQGHTDSSGDASKNWELSDQRANAVRNFLISDGNLDASRLQAQGFGSTRPLPNLIGTDSRNRRVEGYLK